jgi:hypothetical protein
VDRTVDLDEVAEQIAARQSRWRAAGLTVGPVTWRDEAAPWPKQLQTDRASVGDPDSVGVQILGPVESDLTVVVFRGGWADVGYLTLDGHIGAENPGVPTADAAGAVLDNIIRRIWPASSGPAQDVD